jgi:hypothetical protein
MALFGTFRGRNNNMNDVRQAGLPPQDAANSPWAAIGVLGVVVIALGSALYFVAVQQEELRAANNVVIAPGTPAATIVPVPAEPPSQLATQRPGAASRPADPVSTPKPPGKSGSTAARSGP